MREKSFAKSRTRRFSLVVFVLITALGIWVLLDWVWVDRTIRVSRATTFVEGPLDPEGNVDFEAAANRFMSEGVTADNNAIVDLVRVLGPGALPDEMQAEFFEQLGIEPVPSEGPYFLDLAEFGTGNGDASFDANQAFATILDRPWSPDDNPVAEQWLLGNSRVIEAYRLAATRTHLFHPVVIRGTSVLLRAPLPLIDRARDLTRMMAADSLLRMHEKDWPAAIQDIVAIRDLGVLLTRRGSLLQWLVGANFIQRHFELQASLCRQVSAVDPAALPAIAASFAAWNPPEDIFAGPAAMERLALLDGVAAISQRRPRLWEDEQMNERLAGFSRSGLFAMDADVAMENCNQLLDKQFAALFAADRIERDDRLAEFEAELNRQAEKYHSLGTAVTSQLTRTGRARFVTDVMLALMMPAWRTVGQAETRLVQVNDLCKIMFALQIFRIKNGKFPSQLSELPPDFLPTVPADRFTGQPLKYRPDENGFILYSLGSDRLDNGGADYPNDVTLRLSRAD
jgi:hypothetical protein